MKGLCECGCGQATALARQTRRERGHVKGQPLRFLPGHHSRLQPSVVHIGERYGAWTIVAEQSERSRSTGRRWVARCDCGTLAVVSTNNLRSGRTRSCGHCPIVTCPAGHDLTDPANVRVRADGCRECVLCSREKTRRHRAHRVAAYVEDVTSELLAAEVGGWPHAECAWCGTPLTPATAELDHIWPLSRGGTHEPENAVLACHPCNASKGAKLLADWWPSRRACDQRVTNLRTAGVPEGTSPQVGTA